MTDKQYKLSLILGKSRNIRSEIAALERESKNCSHVQEISEKIKHRQAVLDYELCEIKKLIGCTSGEEYAILSMQYLSGLTREKIASIMNYDERTIARKKRQALQHVIDCHPELELT